MDDEEGEKHVELGAKIMTALFGKEWGDFCRYHSRFYAKRDGVNPSRLCVADKYVIAIEPWWLYLPRAWLSGELWEYINARLSEDNKYGNEPYFREKYKYDFRDIWNNPYISKLSKLRYWYGKIGDYCDNWVR